MIDLVLVHFRTTGLAHFEAAWFTLARQDFTDIGHVIVLDNNTDDRQDQLQAITDREPIPVPLIWSLHKHQDPRRTHAWSVNQAMRVAVHPWVFFTRSDFLLDYTCVARFRAERDAHGPPWPGLVTSWCYQMGYDDQLSNTDALAPYSLPEAPWRLDPDGPRSLIGHVPAVPFQTSHLDAGVWLARKEDWQRTGGLNEKLVSWGYAQQSWQRALRRTGVDVVQLPAYLFMHQHHAAPRDFAQASREFAQYGHE